ncbi:hypothetical protein Tco_1179712 [Tanacetum coccineum]
MEFETEFYTAKDVSTAGAAVTTIGASISTAGPPRVSTAEDISTAETLVYIRRSTAKDKGKAKMDESEPEQTKTKLKQRQKRAGYEAAHMGSHTLQQLKRLSFDELKNLFEATMRRVGAFIPMQKTSENSEPAKKSKEKEDDELSQEEQQQLMIIVPEEGMNVEALQTKYPIIDWEVYTEDSRMYWKIIRVGNHTEKHVHDITWRLYDICGVHHVSLMDGIDIYMLVEKEYPLLRGVLTQMLAAKLLVEQNNEISRELLRKIFMMAKRQKRGGLLGIKVISLSTAKGRVSTDKLS